MSAGIQRNDIQQYCTLEDASVKSLSNNYMQFSPTSSTDWWAPIKSELCSPKDSWSSDSDSSQQTLIGNGTDGSLQDMQSPEYSLSLSSTTDDLNGSKKKKKSKDTPAVNKPAQVVARRNARERRRVQAVNGAFQRLRKVVPIEENKSKRMSKVKTLQLAIEYINQLQELLQLTTHHTNDADLLADIFSDFQQQQHVKLEANEYTTFRVPTSFYNHLIGENGEN
ncbi:transcription factor Atoh1-like [Planococcus citri]|uniref:transcription factor Atoh1-like n=1 Tax=Planococcus citri TaxID=170843 RepID=UPI0031F78B65